MGLWQLVKCLFGAHDWVVTDAHEYKTIWEKRYQCSGCHCIDWTIERKVKPIELPKSLQYDWLRDSGSMWEPGSTAFWLEPETCDELAAWVNKYRPKQYGLYVVNDDVRIEWMEPVPQPLTMNPYMNGLRGTQKWN